MKWILLFLCTAVADNIAAQLIITPGVQFYVTGNTPITLQNTNLVNNGGFTAGTGTVSFTGDAVSTISGSQPLQFYQLEINKSASGLLSLQKHVGVSQQINFINGNIDLNGFNIDLGSTGFLNGEQENSRVTGIAGGKILFTTVLNAPAAANPGNLGAIITSSQSLGTVSIGRGHQSQVNTSGTGNSILRYYDIAPANNTNLDATLRFQYFDNELNGLSESSLVLWNSTDNTHWNNLGFTTNNTSSNYIEKTSIPSFSRFTLSSTNNALPVRFILFNTRCQGGSVLLSWKTAMEQNVHYYSVERSTDGVRWTIAGISPAAGNAGIENDYSFVDNAAIDGSYYRIAEYDSDGKVQYSQVLRSNCGNQDQLRMWPNPVIDLLNINMSVNTSSTAVIKIYDGKGMLVKQQVQKLLAGNNLFNVDLRLIASGVYFVTISNDKGLQHSQTIIKK